MKVNDTVFVVTGAGGGIGGELTLELLARGARVAAIDLKQDGLQEIRRRAGSHAEALSIHTLDITDREEVLRLPEVIIETHGAVDGLINCAGIIQPFVKVDELDFEVIERVINVNFYGTINMTKAFLPYLLKRQQSHLVNVSSMGGFLPVPGQSVYGASKAAVKLLTEGLYAELLESPVRVSTVFPGATATNITENSSVAIPGQSDEDTEGLSAKALPADEAAKTIINGIEKDKAQIFTGSDSKFMNRLYRLRPVYATKFIAKQMKSLLEK